MLQTGLMVGERTPLVLGRIRFYLVKNRMILLSMSFSYCGLNSNSTVSHFTLCCHITYHLTVNLEAH